jgi:threonine/homoserine/homoserine lactone efflux protein
MPSSMLAITLSRGSGRRSGAAAAIGILLSGFASGTLAAET